MNGATRDPWPPEVSALELEARAAIRSIRLSVDDLAAMLERLHRVRQVGATAAPEARLIVSETGCGVRVERGL